MHACRDGGLVYKNDLGGPKRLDCVNRLDNAGADGLASNPGLVLLANAEANVNNFDVIHLEACAAGVHSSGEEVEDEGIKPFGRVPISSHALPVCLAILGRCLTILVDESEKGVDEDDLGSRRRRCWKEACT